MVRCYILPVLLYGVEMWTMTEALMRRLESIEMWIYEYCASHGSSYTTNEEEWVKQKK